MATTSRSAAIAPWGEGRNPRECYLFARAGCRFLHAVSCAACVDSLLRLCLPVLFFVDARRRRSASPLTLNDRESSMWCGVGITPASRWQ